MKKERKTHITLIACLFCLIFILSATACGRGGQRSSKDADVYVGFDGITLEFLQNYPPSRMYSGNPVPIIIDVKNKGAYDVPFFNVYLSGFDPGMIIVTPRSPVSISNLEGKKKYNLEGGFKAQEFKITSIALSPGTDSLKIPFMAIACYNYVTEYTPQICVDPNPFLMEDRYKACVTRDVVLSGGQGAPVSIDKISVYNVGSGKMQFVIDISNRGKGEVVDEKKLGLCPVSLTSIDKDVVYYEIPTIGVGTRYSGMAKCEPTGFIKLYNGKGKLVCTFENIPGDTAYETTLNLKFFYGYMNSVRKEVEIINLR